MATLKDYKALYDGYGDLLDRIEGACIKWAGDIRNEDVGTTNHINRLLWAAQVEQDARPRAKEMIARVLANGTIADNPYTVGDGTITSVVGNIINIYATGG